MKRAGRYARGEAHPKARTPDSEIAWALELHAGGMSAAEIGRKLEAPARSVRNWIAGVSRCTRAG